MKHAMKRLIPILGLLLLSSFCWPATPTVVQKAATTAVATSVSTASLTTHTGNAVAVACGVANTSQTFTVSDGTNTYTPVGSANTTQTSEGSMRWFVAQNITGVTHTISCSSATSVFHNIFVYELSGASTSAAVDVPISSATSGASGTSSAAPSFTLPTTTFANDLLLFAASCGNICSAGAGADVGNSQSDGSGDESETFAKTATGTYSGAFSQTASTFIVIGVAITDGGGAAAPTGFNKRQKICKLDEGMC
jgi:hypothetical protein